MAVRITHTNNSDGHDGTFVYRSTDTMDPQNLPTPIADEPPVSLGGVFEYIDGDIAELSGQLCYRTQDHEDGQLGTVSDEACVVLPTDFTGAQIGDDIGGGIYAGTITYPDGREFHIVFAKQVGESTTDLQWAPVLEVTGATDDYDGVANGETLLAFGGTYPALDHCLNYVNDETGHSDYYLPAKEELILVDALRGHPEFTERDGTRRWGSTETTSDAAVARTFNFLGGGASDKTTELIVRPIRREEV